MNQDKPGAAPNTTKTPGPAMPFRWFAFLGWIVVPIVLTGLVAKLFDLQVLWWGPVWCPLALGYMIFYFRWVRRKYTKE